MASWTLDDIPWHLFDPARAEPEIVRLVKAASLVESNGAAYARHLCLVFREDIDFQRIAEQWGAEEAQHGVALARWAALADSSFDFAQASARFKQGFHVDFNIDISRRGSCAGEMVARCVVETGTSSYYAALRDAAGEPVLREICRRIAADELRHYRLFYKNLSVCLARERLGRWARLRVALGRLAETGDDELAYAYFAANGDPRPYDRRRCGRAYERRALALYRRHHIERMAPMLLKAAGFTPNGRLARLLGRLAWIAMRWRAASLARAAG